MKIENPPLLYLLYLPTFAIEAFSFALCLCPKSTKVRDKYAN